MQSSSSLAEQTENEPTDDNDDAHSVDDIDPIVVTANVLDEVAVDTEKEQTDDEDEAPIVVAAKKRKILPALPMPQPGDHLTSIEMRIFGKSYKDIAKDMAAEERIEKLERELELPKDSNMTMKQRVLRIETEATRCAW